MDFLTLKSCSTLSMCLSIDMFWLFVAYLLELEKKFKLWIGSLPRVPIMDLLFGKTIRLIYCIITTFRHTFQNLGTLYGLTSNQ